MLTPITSIRGGEITIEMDVVSGPGGKTVVSSVVVTNNSTKTIRCELWGAGRNIYTRTFEPGVHTIQVPRNRQFAHGVSDAEDDWSISVSEDA